MRVLAIVLAVLLITSGAANAAGRPATLVEITDGDTIKVEYAGKRESVRLIGVDTPESWARRGGKWLHVDEPYASEAADFLAAMLDGRAVTLTFDAGERDRYGRLLAYVWADGIFVNAQLLRWGYARLYIVPPNSAQAERLAAAESVARAEGINVWPGGA